MTRVSGRLYIRDKLNYLRSRVTVRYKKLRAHVVRVGSLHVRLQANTKVANIRVRNAANDSRVELVDNTLNHRLAKLQILSLLRGLLRQVHSELIPVLVDDLLHHMIFIDIVEILVLKGNDTSHSLSRDRPPYSLMCRDSSKFSGLYSCTWGLAFS